MAKQKGFIKLKGSLGGLTFYDQNGKSLVRTTGGVDKQRIESDPAFKRTRENMSEFGGSAKVGKSLRMGFSNVIKKMGKTNVVGRIVRIMKRINSVGSGVRGQRVFEILPNKVLLNGFEFNLESPLDAIFFAPNSSPSLSDNRDIVKWTVPDFDTNSFINAPEGASHFKLVLVTTVLSDFKYNRQLKSYEPVNVIENEVNGIDFSDSIRLSGVIGSDITLQVDLGFGIALPNSVAVISAIGIVFYQEINSQLYELASDNAMRIDAID